MERGATHLNVEPKMERGATHLIAVLCSALSVPALFGGGAAVFAASGTRRALNTAPPRRPAERARHLCFREQPGHRGGAAAQPTAAGS